MRFSFASVIRPAFAVLLASSTAAIVLARLAPTETGVRLPTSTRYFGFNAFYLDHGRRGSIWVDRDGGPSMELPTPEDELMEYASCSPWRDDRGRAQVVGRWSQNLRRESPGTAYGLTRLSFPDGDVLDHFETDVVPVSIPCWHPGTRARVLFAGGDGQLYQYEFETDRSGAGPQGGPGRRVRAVPWNCAIPGGEGVYLSEPNWPSDSRFSHLLFVGLRETSITKGEPRPAVSQIWWLRLGDDGASIEAAGPLIDVPAQDRDTYDRCPTFGLDADGRPLLAYYRRQGRQLTGLHVVPLELDPVSRCPRVASGRGTKLAENCLTCPPIFSRDGRWISIVQGAWGGRGKVRRIALELADDVRGSSALSAVDRGSARR